MPKAHSTSSTTTGDQARLIRQLHAIVVEANLLRIELAPLLEAQWTGREHLTDPGHSDPTGSITVDPDRLALRAVVIDAERRLGDALAGIREARADVRQTIDMDGE